jgi:hypothetical protein
VYDIYVNRAVTGAGVAIFAVINPSSPAGLELTDLHLAALAHAPGRCSRIVYVITKRDLFH